MPALTFLAVVGLMLIASLFFSDAALEKLAQATVASDRSGSIQAGASVPAPTPMTSQGVLAAQPKAPPALDDPTKIEPAAGAARAEVRPTKRVTHPQYRQNNASSHREFGLSGLN
jgi:hypothetical protein